MGIRFDSLDYSTIQSLQLQKESIKHYKIWCNISNLEEPQFIYLDCNKEKLFSSVTLADENDDTITSIPVSKKRYTVLSQRISNGMPIEVVGQIIREPKEGVKKCDIPKFINKIKILRTRPGDKPTRILKASKKEIKIVEKFLDRAKRKIRSGDPWYLLKSIRAASIAKHELSGVDVIPELCDSIETMILQAVSCGFVKNSNGKIHVCLIGGSASGKKLCFKVGELTNVICKEAYPVSVTTVGLTGTCNKSGKWTITKGQIPLAHKGLFGIQDLDKSDKIKQLLEILSFVMEDGRCKIIKAGKAEYLAETGIYIDLNRQKDLNMMADEEKISIIDDIKLRTHILSRFDYICEFNKDVERQFKAVIKSLSKKHKKKIKKENIVDTYCAKNNIEVDRFLKLISAYLMEHYEKIDTDKIEKQIQKHIKEIRNANKDDLKKINDFQQFLFRYRNSCFKFIECLTRIQLKKTANKQSAEKAFELLSRKLNFLQKLIPLKQTSKNKDLFLGWLKKALVDKKYVPKKAYKKWEKDDFPGKKVETRQFQNRVLEYCYIDNNKILRLN